MTRYLERQMLNQKKNLLWQLPPQLSLCPTNFVGRLILSERSNSVEALVIVLSASIVTSKVDADVVCTVTENAGEINESRNVIVSKTKVRPIISIGLLGTLIL